MPIWPLHLVVVAFDELPFPAQVAQQLSHLQVHGIVRLVDAVFIAKSDNGELHDLSVSGVRLDDSRLAGVLSGALFGNGVGGSFAATLDTETGFLASDHGEFGISNDEIDEIADMIPRGGKVAALLLEHLWAADFRGAIRAANGHVLAHGWITASSLINMGIESAG